MLSIPKRAAVGWSASMSIFTGTYFADISSATVLSAHVVRFIVWQGPHHDAVKYAKTGLCLSRASDCAAAKSVRQGMMSWAWAARHSDTPTTATTVSAITATP